MARKKHQPLTFKASIIQPDGSTIPWYEIDEKGNTTYHISQQETDQYVKKMLDNIGRNMSDYCASHPESALWGKTNFA